MRILIRLFSIAYIVVFTFYTNLSFAQIKYGPKVGLNYSELPNNTKFIIGNQQMYGGYHLGAIAEFRLFGQLYLQPGVMIVTKGSKYIVGNNTLGSTTGFSDFEFSTLNADIPLNLMYKFNLGSFKLFLIAGPNIEYGLTGKWKASYGTSSNVHFGNGPDDDLKPFDYGLNIGGGLEVGRIQFSSLYYMGLKTLSVLSPPLKEQKYKVLSISIAYLFGKDKRVYKDYENKYWNKQRQKKGTRKKHF